MTRCVRCWMPDTRPGSRFVDGVCGACRNYDKRKQVNWEARWAELEALCNKYRAAKPYNCLIPVSGGKDSYMLTKIMVEDMEMRPLLVTVTDSFTHTRAGVSNLRNLISRYNLNHWQYTISHDLFRRATRWAFESSGEPLKFVEYAIYTVPWNLARALGIGLIVFGENSAYEYGSTEVDGYNANPVVLKMGSQMEMERDWWRAGGVMNYELDSIKPIVYAGEDVFNPQVIYMSYFKPWSSLEHLKEAQKRGFLTLEDTKEWRRDGTIEQFEQIDSMGYMVHLWMKYPKFGFQRAMDIASRRLREGTMGLEEVKEVAEEVDPILDQDSEIDFRKATGYSAQEFADIYHKWDKQGVLADIAEKWDKER